MNTRFTGKSSTPCSVVSAVGWRPSRGVSQGPPVLSAGGFVGPGAAGGGGGGVARLRARVGGAAGGGRGRAGVGGTGTSGGVGGRGVPRGVAAGDLVWGGRWVMGFDPRSQGGKVGASGTC